VSASRFQAVSLPAAPLMGPPKSPPGPLRLRDRPKAHEVTFAATAPPSPPHCFSASDVPEPPVSPLSIGHTRVSSVPPPSSPIKGTFRVNHSLQCTATTKAGGRCQNRTKPPSHALKITDPSSSFECFCHRHIKDLPPPTKVLPVNDRMQCNGLIRAGKRCKRTIKPPQPLMIGADPSSKDLHLRSFCRQHVKDLWAPSGFRMMPGVDG
jgi:hypothetical protein